MREIRFEMSLDLLNDVAIAAEFTVARLAPRIAREVLEQSEVPLHTAYTHTF